MAVEKPDFTRFLDSAQKIRHTTKDYPKYNFFCIPADDVRTKKATKPKAAVVGLIEKTEAGEYKIKEEYVNKVKELFYQVNLCLNA